jgi:D-alanyl-D-alanine carboxypeptidase
MFPWILALTLYALVGQSNTTQTLIDFGFTSRSFLPLSSKVEQSTTNPVAPTKKDPARLGIETKSKAAVIMDWETGKFLFKKNADEPLPVASITKLVTALVTLESNVDLDRPIDILSSDVRLGGASYIMPGEKIKIIDLIHASLISSENSASVALSRSTEMSQEEFVKAMNRFAEHNGLKNFKFTEPSGLDAKNVASAKDVAILVRQALRNEIIREIVLKNNYEFDAVDGLHHSLRNTDDLLTSLITQSPYGFLGGKTGFLEEAGYCFGAAARNSDGNRVVAVVLGAADKKARFNEVSGLIYWAFDAYTWPKL